MSSSYIVLLGLKKLGADLKDARKRRRIKMALMAERINVTRSTLVRMERGDAGVSMGTYATAIFALDPSKFEEIKNIFSSQNDVLGQTLSDMHLPKRIRGPSKI